VCNAWCNTFVADSLPDWPQAPEVLEVGSRNVNGSARAFCAPRSSRYVGCDLEAGDGVDVIADATRLTAVFPPESFDVAITTEMMEHVPDWPSAWAELMAVLRPGGLLILSTRSPGFPLHSYPGDFWRFTADDIRGILEGVGDILHLDDDATMGYPCGIGVVVRKRTGIDLSAWRSRLAGRVPLYNMEACAAITYEAFSAGIPPTGELNPLRQRIRELEQTVFDAQIAAQSAHNAANQLAMSEEELLRARVKIQALEGSLEAWRRSVFGRSARVAYRAWNLACLPVRIGRCLLNPTLRSRTMNHLDRRWHARFGGRRIQELPDLDWLLEKLDLDVPVEQVTARLGSYLTRREEAAYRAMIGALRTNASGLHSKVMRALDLSQMSTAAKIPPVKRLRLLYVCGEFPNPIHGGGGHVADFIKVLSEQHDVYVAAWYNRQHDHQAFVGLAPYCRALRGLSFEDIEGGCVRKLMDLIGNKPVDIVHYEWPRSLNSFDRSLGRHHIFTHMESVSCSLWMDLHRLEPLSPDWMTRLAQWLSVIKVETLDAGRADAQIVVTPKDGAFLSSFVPGKTYYVLNHGINMDEFNLPETTPEPHTLVFIGNFKHPPNQDAVHFFMSKVWPRILAQIPDARFLIVGANPPANIQHYHDGSQVVVTGYVPDVNPYVQQASVCVAPLVSGAGWRNKVIQYAALRRPSVVTPIAAEDVMLENGRDIFIVSHPDEYAARVLELLGDPDRAKVMAEQARTKVLALYDNRRIVKVGMNHIYRLLDAERGST